MAITSEEQNKVKRMKRTEDSLRDPWDNIKSTNIQKRQNDLYSFPRQTIQYCSDPTSNAEETEVERFYEDLQDLLEPTHKKDVLFFIED